MLVCWPRWWLGAWFLLAEPPSIYDFVSLSSFFTWYAAKYSSSLIIHACIASQPTHKRKSISLKQTWLWNGIDKWFYVFKWKVNGYGFLTCNYHNLIHFHFKSLFLNILYYGCSQICFILISFYFRFKQVLFFKIIIFLVFH